MPVYSPTDWSDGQTPVDAVHLDKMEAGITAAQRLEEKGVPNGYAALDATGKVSPAQLPATASPIPVGSVVDFAGAAAPAGWLLCDGASLLRTAYPLLYNAIGTAFGALDGTHFSLPDTRGRMTVGRGTRSEVDAVGDSDNLALASRRPQHRHTVNESAHGHGVSDSGHNHGVNDPGHGHTYAEGSAATGVGSQSVLAAIDASGYMGDGAGAIRNVGTGIWLNGSGAGVSVNGAFTSLSVGNASDYLDSPPFLTLNKIIKAD